VPRLRLILFWSHLLLGAGAGSIIFIMSATGALLALQPQILAWMERDVRRVTPSVERKPLSQLIASASAANAGAAVASVTVDADPSQAAQVSFGREGMLFVDPGSARVSGRGATATRALFQQLTAWHRWLGTEGEARPTARSLTGASNLAFLLLAISGLFLWWPRTWTRRVLQVILTFQPAATGRARDFNWHHVIGFWCAPILIILTATAVVMSYPWANALVYRLAGSDRPSATRASAGRSSSALDAGAADQVMAAAAARLSTWSSMTLRLPQRAGDSLAVSIVDGAYWNRYARSQLTLDPATGAVLRWEPYSGVSRGQKLRGWIRFAHTGELAGLPGQLAAGLGCLGGMLLVWTGWSLAVRRLASSQLVRLGRGRRLTEAAAR
jgi:uncharacterized iron-regulated membrane protein